MADERTKRPEGSPHRRGSAAGAGAGAGTGAGAGAGAGGAGAHAHRTLSAVFVSLANGTLERISIADIDEALRGRSFGPFVIAFSIPNLLPFPPGTSTVLGLPLLFIGWQMARGHEEVWMPAFLRRRSVSRRRYRSLLDRGLPWLRRTEAMMRPRRWPFAPGHGGKTLGLALLVLAMLVVVPVPFANWLPAAACFCLGVALTARDGLWLGASAVVGTVAFAIFVGIVLLAFLAVEAVVD